MSRLAHGQLLGSQFERQNWGQLTGVAGLVPIPAGACILSITCYATAAGATLQIGGGPVIALGTPPVGGSRGVDIDVGGGVVGPLNVTFTGTDNYLIDLATV
jgi:hypothetical protein